MIFGPVPSRRLGNSLGINNIPPKECSYSCVYCQLGNTLKLEIKRKKYYSTKEIVSELDKHLSKFSNIKDIDYITFVPDGEPTLDINLGKTIKECKKFGIKIAIITNSSLIWDENVQESLYNADWVSLKIDTVNNKIWHKLDRPHRRLSLEKILFGIRTFAKNYKNYLATETMLVKNINDDKDSLSETAEFIKTVNPSISYITIPTRPPAVEGVLPPSMGTINQTYQIFKKKKLDVELIIGYEGNEFSFTGNFINDILNITAVHPMRKDAVENLLKKDNSDWAMVKALIQKGELIETIHNNEYFYLRNLKRWRKTI